jgi:predicted DNA-binding transcriptional regulator AlpA
MGENYLIDVKKLSKFLSIPQATIYEHNVMGKIPAPLKIGKKLLWRIDEIKEWLNAGAPGRQKWESIKD